MSRLPISSFEHDELFLYFSIENETLNQSESNCSVDFQSSFLSLALEKMLSSQFVNTVLPA